GVGLGVGDREYHRVGLRDRDVASFRFRQQVLQICAAGHVHGEARGKSFHGGVLAIAGVAVRDEAMDGVGVADNESVVLPGVAQNIVQKPTIAAGGNVVQVHVGAHEAADAGIGGGFEGEQVRISQLLFGGVGRVVVASAVGGTVSGEVLGAGQDFVWRAELGSLKSEDLSAGDGGSEVGIFPGAFDHASPASVADDVEHGCEGPRDASGAGFT